MLTNSLPYFGQKYQNQPMRSSNKNFFVLFSFLFFISFTLIFAQETQPLKGIKVFGQNQVRAASSPQQIFDEEFQLSSENEFILQSNKPDNDGYVHQRYQQYYSGVKVEFGQTALHNKNGQLRSMSYNVYQLANIDMAESINNTAAFNKAVSYVGATKYLWEDNAQAALVDSYEKPQGELVVLPNVDYDGKVTLAYKFDIYAIEPLYRADVYVDAKTGVVLFENYTIHQENAPATGESLYNGTVSFTTDDALGNFRLRQTAIGGGVNTFDLNNGSNYAAASDISSSTNVFPVVAATGVQAHWGAERTYTYFLDKHGRNSYDNNGSPLNSYVSYGFNYVNAFWDGSRMTYGDGDGVNYGPLVSLDIVGHEISHGVTQNSANLVYRKESGALNESFSDIFGEAIENFGAGTNDWLMGDQIGAGGNGGALRSFSNPNQYGDPDTYGGTNWRNPNCSPSRFNDYCGVHTNSGVQNYWFYLLSTGGSGTNDIGSSYSVASIGMSKAASVAYRNLTVYLSNTSNYNDARLGAIQSAIDLYGAGSLEEIAVTNAWYAVGVGDEYPGSNRPFVTTWKTDNPGTSENNQITIPTYSEETYNYSVNWGDGISDSGITGNITHTYDVAGTYEVSISGNFPRIYFSDQGDKEKIILVNQWSDIEWTSLQSAFSGCTNLDVVAVDIPNFSGLSNINSMFMGCSSLIGNSFFSDWVVSNVTTMQNLFAGAALFNQPIGAWDVSNVKDMTGVFSQAQLFNQPIGEWDVSSVDSMFDMFGGATSFNQSLANWDVGNVIDMLGMFARATSFNQNIGNWNIRKVVDMGFMFDNVTLSLKNYDSLLIGWSNLPSLVNGIPFSAGNSKYCEGKEARQKLIDDYGWVITDAGKSEDCQEEPNDFTLRINTGGATTTFDNNEFITDTGFDTGNTLNRPQTGLSEPYKTFRYSRSKTMAYDIPVQDGEYTVKLHFAELWFGATGGGSGGVGSRVFDVSIEGQLVEDNLDVFAEAGADSPLVKTHTVTVTGGVLDIDFSSLDAVGGTRHPIINAIEVLGSGPVEPRPFVTTWKTDNEGDSADNQIIIPTSPNEQYFYSVDWGDGTSNTGVTGNIMHTFSQPGTYQVSITGTYPAIVFGRFGLGDDRHKITAIDQWGDIKWKTFESSFLACTNMTILASDIPDLENVKTLSKAFYRCSSLSNNGHFENWDVSSIEDMSQLFSETSFNQDIGSWDISKVQNTHAMFYQTPFNHDIGDWNTSSVVHMRQMFMGGSFNQDIGSWDVAKVRNFEQMFTRTPFNQDIGNWDTGSATDIRSMFQNTPFNQDISDWNVGNVERMAYMFDDARNFNQDIGNWDVSKVKYAQGMFRDAVSFNQDLSSWNTLSLIIAQRMFQRASSFNRDLGSWNIENVTNMEGMFNDVSLSTENYDSILNNWSSQNVQSSVEFDGGNSQYCESQAARQRLVDMLGWVIVDGGRTTDCEVSGPENNFALRFNTGGDLVEYNGDVFLTDNNFVGGSSVLKRPQTGLPEPYQSFRFSRSKRMWYNIPLADGEYIINLYFAELWFGATGGGPGGIGSRVFDITMEDQLVQDNLDVFAEVGADAMLVKSYTVTVIDGVLDIDFDSRDEVGGKRHPIINAIEIIGGEQSTSPPVVSAGPDQTILLEDTYFTTFNGTAIDPDGGDIVSYEWTQQSGPSTPALSGENTADLTVTYILSGTYVFRLTVIDDENEVSFDEVQLVAIPVTGSSPEVNSGEDQNIVLPISAITLNGSANDPDGGDIVSYVWTQQSGPNTAALSGDNTANLSVSNLIEGSYVFRLTVIDDENDTAFDETTVTVLPEPDTGDFALRINTGGSTTTFESNEFVTDAHFNTGNTLNRPQTGLSEPYKTFRYSRSRQMSYDIPIPDGEYTVNLHFAELWFGATGGGAGGVGSRVFDVNIEGQLVEDNLDVFAEVGAQAALVKTHTVTVTGGVLDIDFSSLDAVGGTRHPIINAIEVLGMQANSGKNGSLGKWVNTNTAKLSPNPASTTATLSFEKPAELITIQMFDVMGRLVKTYNSTEVSADGVYSLDVKSLSPGTYFIKSQSATGQVFQKQMVIKK